MADRGNSKQPGHSEVEIHSCSSITENDAVECKMATIIVADLWRWEAL